TKKEGRSGGPPPSPPLPYLDYGASVPPGDRMQITSHRLQVATRGKGLYEITGQIATWLESVGVRAGLLTVFVQHTSASLTIQENADPDVVHDLNAFFNRLVPEDSRLYRHT